MAEERSECPPGSPELRLVLLGLIGCGKTMTGDTILGERYSAPSCPRTCQQRQGLSEGRWVTLVEAPRWYWSGGEVEATVKEETQRALPLSHPGPHAFLILIPVGEFTEGERRVPAELESVFGNGVLRHTMVLLTSGDYLMGKSGEDYLAGENPGLREVVERCGGRFHVINNRRPQDREQVRALMAKVDHMVQENGGCYVPSALQGEVENRVLSRERQTDDKIAVKKGEEERGWQPSVTQAERNGEMTRQDIVPFTEGKEREEREETMKVRHIGNGLQAYLPRQPSPPPEQPPPQPETPQHTPRPETPEHTPRPETPQHSPRPETPQHTPRPETPQHTPRPETPPSPSANSPVTKNSSFRLTEDGALLCQLSEAKLGKNFINTIHHQISSFDEDSIDPLPSTSSSPSSFAPSPSSSQSSELRLVLLGRTGAGKSTAGNRILGREEFVTQGDSKGAVTRDCEKRKGTTAGRRVALVDTPDWFCSELPPEDVQRQVSTCVALAAPGPHAFLLCVPVDQPAQIELQAVGALEAVFGKEAVRRHTLVLFTHSDRLRESGGVEEYIITQRKDLLQLVERCGDHYHVLEPGSGTGEREASVRELLEKVEQTVRENGDSHYTCILFQEAESRVRERQEEIMRERRERGGAEHEEGPEQERATSSHSSLYSLPEIEEEELEQAREEAENSVRDLKVDALPSLSSSSSSSSSMLHSVWEKVAAGAQSIPKLIAGGALLGGMVGVIFGGLLGGVVGATAGSVVTEVGRRKYSQKYKTE